MLGRLAAVLPFVVVALVAPVEPVSAQKAGGTLRVYHRNNPPSGSILEEATIDVTMAYMPVFNNLVIFDQAKQHESADTIVPDLATSWSWDDTKTKLTFKLREGVKWHDGQPFTAKDVQCTWNMLAGKLENADFRRNPRKIWYFNLNEVTINGDYEATFNLKAPQPSFLLLLASGYSPVYPCHVPPSPDAHQARSAPGRSSSSSSSAAIRSGWRSNQDYWKKDRPYLDAIDIKIIENRSTRILAFTSGEFDLTFPTDVSAPLMKDVKSQAPKAICQFLPDRCRDQPDRQPEQAAVRQCRRPQGDGADARPQRVQHHPERGHRRHRRHHAAAAQWRLGHAEGAA